MPDIGYYTLPVIPSFRGITGQIQDQLNKAFKDTGTLAGQAMGQAAGAAMGKDSPLGKAVGQQAGTITILTDATNKQTEAVGRLDTAHKRLRDTQRGSSSTIVDEQTKIIVGQNKHTEALRKSEDQVKRVTKQHDDLTAAVRRAGEEQARQAKQAQKDLEKYRNSITAKQAGGAAGAGSITSGSIADQLRSDLNKALSGDTQGAIGDLGSQIGAQVGKQIHSAIKDATGVDLSNDIGQQVGRKIRGTIDDTVKDVTGMRVDAIIDKIDSGAKTIGVDTVKVLQTARDDGLRAAVTQAGSDIATKAGGAAGGFLNNQFRDLTGIDIGAMPGSQQLGQMATDWVNNGGSDQIADFLAGGGLGRTIGGAKNTIQSLRAGGLKNLLRKPDLSGVNLPGALGNINDFTGGAAQPIVDMHSQINDIAEGLLGGTAAEKFLPAIADAALPIALGTMGGKGISNFIAGHNLFGLGTREENAYDDTGTAKNPFERFAESIPGIGSFLRPSDAIRNANKQRAAAAAAADPTNIDNLYAGVFGSPSGGGGAVSAKAEQVDVQSTVAQVTAGNVVIGGNLSLPASVTGGLGGGGGGAGGGRGAASSAAGGSGSEGSGTASLYAPDTGTGLIPKGKYAGGTGGAGVSPYGRLYGPGTPTSDSILGVDASGMPTALVSVGEGIVKERAMRAGGGAIVAALNRYAGGTGGGGIGGLNTSGAQVDTIAVAQAVQQLFGISNIGMYRSPDGFNEHSSGEAADVMVGSKAVGDQVARWVLGHAAEYGVQYVLWQQRQWNPDGSSSPMADRGGPTQNHMDHVHIRTAGGGYPSGGGPGASGAGSFPGGTSNTPAPGVNQAFNPLTGGGMGRQQGLGGAAGGPGGMGAMGGPGAAGAMAAFQQAGGMAGLGQIGQSFLKDTFGFGSILPDPTQWAPVQFLMGLLGNVLPGGQNGLGGLFTGMFGGGSGTFGQLGSIVGGLANSGQSPFGMLPGMAPGAGGMLDPDTASGVIPGMLPPGAGFDQAPGGQQPMVVGPPNMNVTINGDMNNDMLNRLNRQWQWAPRVMTYGSGGSRPGQ